MEGYTFTATVRRSLAAAREHATTLKHDCVGAEHLLLGLVTSEEQTLGQVWSTLSVSPEDLRSDILAILPPGRSSLYASDLPYTRNAKRALEFAMREAAAFGDTTVEPTHLLLGIIRLADGNAARTLQQHGVTTNSVRQALSNLRERPLTVTSVASIAITVQLQDGTIIERNFEGGDENVLYFLSAYLLRD